MRRGHLWRVATATTLVMLAPAGCSSGHSSSSSSSGAGGTATSSSPTGAATGATTADAATKSAIEKAYTTFYNSATKPAQSEAVLQHGALFRATLAKEASSSYAKKSTAFVSGVTMASADVADVTFGIKNNGKLLLGGIAGKAVRENGTWKVADTTFCTLLKLEGTAPALCTDPSVVSLPTG